MTIPILQIKHLSKSLQQTPILKNITFNIKKGEIVTIVGPSGGGKTTLLRCINRLIEPDNGCIIFNNQNITNMLPTALRKTVILVPQESVMFPGTVKDNISLALRIHNINNDNKISESLTDTGLPKTFLNKKAQQLSGGEKKRVSLARALALSPTILLLDEPTTGIDPKNLHTVEQRIIRFTKQRNLTALWVTHDVSQAKRVSDRIANLKQGQITTITTPNKFQWEEAY
ncbi:MAG: ATP-binding cassette domain-containing protein [Candidatus Thermoplasmatota archaeon]|nr:ATP-binding cassette domain-containing protein [Candidatus Thermoplasmatota archaeon]